jgi:prevent-host-death family protein
MRKVRTESLSALTARTQFGQVMERASRNRERFLVTRKGEAKVMILGVEDFASLVGDSFPELTKLQEQAKRSGASKLSMREINAEIRKYRKERAKARA